MRIASRFVPYGLWLLALSSCSGPAPREGRGPAGARVPSNVAPITAAQPMTWTASLGPGGAEVAAWPVLPTPQEAALRFSRLLGIVILPEQRELFFVGEHDGDGPTVDADDLLDALAISLRALPVAPGVSIDPSAAQLTRGLRPRDEMGVRYIGGDEGSVLGAAAFEADRLMKCLSFGRDNVSNEPFACAVAGYRNELDAALDEPIGQREEWHRFWIEQQESPVTASADGRMVLFGARLGIRTQYMEVAGGALRSSDRRPSESAKAFADHLTVHYDEYARELPVFATLRTLAQMTTLAHALNDPNAPATVRRAASTFDVSTLLDRRPRPIATPMTTPAIRAQKESASGASRRRIELTGGVDLTPKPRYTAPDAAADALARRVLDAINASPGRAARTIPHPDGTLVAVRRSVAPVRTRMWQTDMTVDRLRFARVLAGDARSASIGRDWQPMLPELQFSTDAVAVRQLGTMPRSVTITLPDGRPVTLGQHATLQMPGQPATSGFTTGTGSSRVALYRYRNALVVEQGDIEYVSINNGPPTRRIPPSALVVDFSPDAPHRPQRIETSEGSFNVLWAGGRLLGYQAESGARIEVRYGPGGEVVGLRGSDGQVVDYRLDPRRRLRSAVDGQGRSVSYRLPEGGGDPTGIWTEIAGAPPLTSVAYPRFEAARAIPRDALRQQTAQLSTETTVFIGVLDTPAGSERAIASVVAGQDVAPQLDVERAVEAVLEHRRADNPHADLLRRAFLDAPASRGRSNVVVVGEPSLRNAVARALTILAPERSVSTAADPGTAARNLARLRTAGRGVRHVHVVEGLEASVNDAVQRLATAGNGGGSLVIASGHNSTEFQATLERMGAAGELRDKTVVLVTCGAPGGALDGLLRDAGASQVIAFDQPINQQVLEPFLTELHRRLEATTTPAAKIRSIVDDVIKDLRTRGGMNLNEDDVRVLELQVRQIGRAPTPSDGPQRTSGPAGDEPARAPVDEAAND